ncbi:RICIN domain-containing protein [Streptomyces cinnamoneus]|uniref:RICIN domain-containing protein n=1 Tax=Streptomyces cinnamoneus TaxID=53446 RepID=UPI003410AA10
MRASRRTGRRVAPALAAAGIMVVAALDTASASPRTPQAADEGAAAPAGAAPAGVAAPAPAGATAAGAAAALVSGPDTCVPGMVWRKARPNDLVCVTQLSHAAILQQNAEAPAHTRADGSCTFNWVWRRATPLDRVCVSPTTAGIVRQQTAVATKYWAATADKRNGQTLTKDPFWFPNAFYRIHSIFTGDPWLFANVFGGSTADGTKVTLRSNTPGRQNFTFRRVGDGVAYQNVFEIVARHSGKCLDVQGFSKNDGAPVIQWPCHGGSNQKWYFHRRADNLFEIRSLDSDKCLDAANANNPVVNPPRTGAPLQQWTCLGNKNQAWQLFPPN